MLVDNVVQLENESTKIYDQIRRYFERHENRSEKTRIAYENDVKQFFQVVKNKQINELTMEDIQLTLDDFEDFVYFMKNSVNENGERRFSNKTINRKVSGVKGLVKYLAAKKIINDVSYLDLIESLPEETNSYGVLESWEVFKMAELALEEREKGEIKRLLILFAFDTRIRKDAILKLKWSDFIVRENDVLVKGIDKGNKEFRETISKDFYEELLTIKEEGQERVFNISKRALDSTFERLKKKMNFPEERRITFHSLKKAGVNFVFKLTKNILIAQKAAHHSRLDTTRIYLQDEEVGLYGGVSSRGKTDKDLYKKVNHDVLIQALNHCNEDLKLILNIKIQEILNTK